MIFLGEIPPRGIRFKTPGAVHHARFMSKAIYSLKIYLFNKQFQGKDQLSVEEIPKLANFCIYVVVAHVNAWYTSGNPASAPRHDIEFLKTIQYLQTVDSTIATAAAKKIENHLWYLSEELAPLGFFDEKLSLDCKRKMIVALQTKESVPENSIKLDLNELLGIKKISKKKNFPKKKIVNALALEEQGVPDNSIELDVNNLKKKIVNELTVDKLISKSSMQFFEILGLPCDFLNENPSIWESLESYQISKSIIDSLQVVNDRAERCVALISEYNKTLTYDENKKDAIIKIVKRLREIFPNFDKQTLEKNFLNTYFFDS